MSSSSNETTVRTLGVNQMHMRAGSGKWNNPVSKKSGEQSQRSGSSAKNCQDPDAKKKETAK